MDRRDRLTREVRWEQLEDDMTYGANALDRDVVATDQIRTVIRTFKEKLRPRSSRAGRWFRRR